MKKIAIALILVMTLTLCLAFVGCGDKNSLTDREQAIYQLVLDASYKFKNPSAVRVVSGKAKYEKITDENSNNKEYSTLELERGYFISAELRLSSTNGYGATTTDYWHIIYDRDGKISVDNINDIMKDFMNLMEQTPALKPTLLPSLQAAANWYDECEIIDDFNIDKINAELEKKWNP